MSIREISYESHNGRDTVKGWVYTPTIKPKAIVQIVHGFGEHSRRYLHLILQMLDAGFIVCADDHVGHGKTASDANTWGDYGFKGYKTTTEDEYSLHNLISKEFPNLPYFMFGHSWGSMIARDYASKHGDTLNGLILCGTVSKLENTDQLFADLKKLVDDGQGAQVKPEYLGELLKGFTSRYDNPRTSNDWIATDGGIVDDHAADPFNNFQNPPNIQALYDFLNLWIDISCKEWAASLRNDLPVYIIAGDQDPVGNYGEGVYQVANWLWATGKKKVKTQIYSGYRHEIHNEPEIRDTVEAGIIEFINSTL
jgi:alpha-beta hydrolase superfamily lysophospholipase